MPVLLHTSRHLPAADAFDRWVSTGREPPTLNPAQRRAGIAAAMEEAFGQIASRWLEIGRALAADPSATLAHMPSCAPDASDFGTMLVWDRLVEEWAAAATTTLVVCDDPWLFRHLRGKAGVEAGNPPPRHWREARAWLRGILARTLAALRFAVAALALKSTCKAFPKQRPVLLTYGHPASTAADDAYFGGLMVRFPETLRLLHVDCAPRCARGLAGSGRTFSLHAWGSPLFALTLAFATWKPRPIVSMPWLIRRAAILEGATAQAAAIAWQIHCQSRWMERAEPKLVAWPWENHGWERALARAGAAVRIPTVGYQHAAIGGQMLNYSASSIPDPETSLPQQVVCTGPAMAVCLGDLGIPRDRLSVGGALRFASSPPVHHDPAAPVFVALPFHRLMAQELLDAVRTAAGRGLRFRVRAHPMSAVRVIAGPGIESAEPLSRQAAVSAVVYAATTVGLEALFQGLPTIRFRCRTAFAVDTTPIPSDLPVADASDLVEVVRSVLSMPSTTGLERAQVFAAVDDSVWQRLLAGN